MISLFFSYPFFILLIIYFCLDLIIITLRSPRRQTYKKINLPFIFIENYYSSFFAIGTILLYFLYP